MKCISDRKECRLEEMIKDTELAMVIFAQHCQAVPHPHARSAHRQMQCSVSTIDH